MDALILSFLPKFWWLLVASCAGLGLARLLMPARLPFLSPQSFPELARFSLLDQHRMLRSAYRKADRLRSYYAPAAVVAICWATGFTIVEFARVTLPQSSLFWVTSGIMVGICCSGFWLATRIAVRNVRPHLLLSSGPST